jgi:hypothetical protein
MVQPSWFLWQPVCLKLRAANLSRKRLEGQWNAADLLLSFFWSANP